MALSSESRSDATCLGDNTASHVRSGGTAGNCNRRCSPPVRPTELRSLPLMSLLWGDGMLLSGLWDAAGPESAAIWRRFGRSWIQSPGCSFPSVHRLFVHDQVDAGISSSRAASCFRPGQLDLGVARRDYRILGASECPHRPAVHAGAVGAKLDGAGLRSLALPRMGDWWMAQPLVKEERPTQCLSDRRSGVEPPRPGHQQVQGLPLQSRKEIDTGPMMVTLYYSQWHEMGPTSGLW